MFSAFAARFARLVSDYRRKAATINNRLFG